MDKPFLSVIIPAYNAEKVIENCVKSLLSQPIKDIELIIVDDGSKDKTVSICNQLSIDDPRIKLLQQENSGSGKARNLGLQNAHGKWVMFIDSDDTLIQNSLDFLNGIQEEDADLYIFGYDLYSKNKVKSTKKYEAKSISGCEMRKNFDIYFSPDNDFYIRGFPWNKVYDGNIIRDNHLEFPDLRRHQDGVFVLSYLGCVKKVRFIPNVIYKYNAPNSLEASKKLPENYIDIIDQKHSKEKDIISKWGCDMADDVIEEGYAFHIVKACENIVFREPIYAIPTVMNKVKKIMASPERIHAIKNAKFTSYGSYKMVLKYIQNGNWFLMISYFNAKKIVQVLKK